MRTTTRIVLAGLISVLAMGAAAPAASAAQGQSNIVWCCR